MDGKEVVRRLIAGSEVIDRMRREVESVVRMILGMLGEMPEGFNGVDFRSSGYHWKVSMLHPSGAVYVECWKLSFGIARREYERPILEKRIYSTRPEMCQLYLEDVETVHEALSGFVEGIAEAFPVLNERWRPLLIAGSE